MENTGLPTVGCYATKSTGVVSISMEIFNYCCLAPTRVLHSNDGIRPNTSHYFSFDFLSNQWGLPVLSVCSNCCGILCCHCFAFLKITGILPITRKLALSKGPRRVGVFLPSPEDRNRPNFWNFLFQTVNQVQNPNNSGCHAPSSESFRSFLAFLSVFSFVFLLFHHGCPSFHCSLPIFILPAFIKFYQIFNDTNEAKLKFCDLNLNHVIEVTALQ
jgi:hypothetical protein